VSQSVLSDGIAQGLHDVILAENIVKCAGAVFAGEYLVTHWWGMGKGG
jgi:hypothetical protein